MDSLSYESIYNELSGKHKIDPICRRELMNVSRLLVTSTLFIENLDEKNTCRLRQSADWEQKQLCNR